MKNHETILYSMEKETGMKTQSGIKVAQFKVGETRAFKCMDPFTLQMKTIVHEFVECGGTGVWVRRL